MARLVPLSGSEAARTTKAASIETNELHTTSDQQRLFFENAIVAPVWHGAVADQTAMLALKNRYSAATISAASADNSINDSAAGFPPLSPGDFVTIDGFTGTEANNQAGLEVVTRTASKIVLTGGVALVNDAAGETVTLTKDGTRGCWPGDKCKRTDLGTIWECISNNGGLIGDWIEITTDRIGTVKMWSGTAANIPTGYGLCDGGGGRPNLVDRFVLGTATDGEIGNTGGTAAHTHAVGTLADTAASAGTPTGTNSAPAFTGTPVAAASTQATPDLVAADVTGAGVSPVTTAAGSVAAPTFTGNALGNHSHGITGKTANPENGAGSTATNDVLPPWYKLAFIIRVS